MAPRLGLGGGVTANPASGLFGSKLLLDTFTGAAKAYSVRKLRTEYTGYAMKIRVDATSDRTADVAFDDDGFVSASSKIYNPSADGEDGDTLAEFIDADNEVYVHTWYDQSGSGDHATDKTTPSFLVNAANQPKLYTGNNLVTDVTGDGTPRAALLFDNADILHMDKSGLSLGSNAVFTVMRNTTSSGGNATPWFLSYQTSPAVYFGHLQYTDASTTSGYFYYDTGFAAAVLLEDAYGTYVEKRRLYSMLSTAGSQTAIANGTSDSAGSPSYATTAFAGTSLISGFGNTVGFFGFTGKFQEFIYYSSDQTSNNAAIVGDINTALEVY